MKTRITLLVAAIIVGGLLWYLLIKPYDYLATIKTNTFPGVVNQSIKSWVGSKDLSIAVDQVSITDLSHELKVEDSTFVYTWKITPLTDTTSQVKIYVKDLDHSFSHRISNPFSETDFKKTTKRMLLEFNEKLKNHIKDFKVKIVGFDATKATYCAYVQIETTQIKKARGMMKNYSLLDNFIASNKIKPNGTPMIEITKWDINTDSIQYNFCYPILKTDSLPVHDLIKYKELDTKTSIKAIYNGNYISSDRSWYRLLDYAKKNNITVIPKPIEVFHNNPNFGGNELEWKTEVFMPIE